MQTMSFAEFQWPQNPATLSVSYTRMLREQHLPYHGSILQDFGKQCVTVSGEGVFYGERRQEHFDALRQFQESGTVGVLRLPGHSPHDGKTGKAGIDRAICAGQTRVSVYFLGRANAVCAGGIP